MTKWIYYFAFFSIDGSVDQPAFLVRLRSGYPESSAERLDRSGQWMHSSTIIEAERGGAIFEVEIVTRDQAVEFAREWFPGASPARLPDDLA